MIALPATLLKILLSTALLTALTPLILYKHKRFLGHILLSSITACFMESLNIAYFYIYSGRASWKLASIGDINIEFALEPLGIILVNLLTGIWGFVMLCKIISQNISIRFLTLFGVFIFSSIAAALSRNLFTMFIFYIAISYITIILAQDKFFRNVSTLSLSFKFIGSALSFLSFILFIYYSSYSTEFTLGGILPDNIDRFLLQILLFAAFFGIGKIVMFQTSLLFKSETIDEDSIFQSIVIINIGLFSILKIIIYILGIDKATQILSELNWPLLSAASTLLYVSYKSIRSNIIKHILIYSIISGTCFALISILALTSESIIAGISYMIAHSFTSISLLFVFSRWSNSIDSTKIEKLKSLGYKFPLTSIFFIISSLSLIGVPLFAAANSKKLIWESLESNHYSYILAPILLLSIIATAYYVGRLIYFLLKKPNTYKKQQSILALDIATGFTVICVLGFHLVEKFLDSILWSIL